MVGGEVEEDGVGGGELSEGGDAGPVAPQPALHLLPVLLAPHQQRQTLPDTQHPQELWEGVCGLKIVGFAGEFVGSWLAKNYTLRLYS